MKCDEKFFAYGYHMPISVSIIPMLHGGLLFAKLCLILTVSKSKRDLSLVKIFTLYTRLEKEMFFFPKNISKKVAID